MEKCPILDQHHGLTSFEKCQFFDFLNAERRFFVEEYHKTFPYPILPKKKNGKMTNFGPTPWTNPNPNPNPL